MIIASKRKDFISLVKIDAFGSRGGFSIRSGSGGLKPRAMAGSPSVAKLIYKICTGNNGNGNHNKIAIVRTAISTRFD